MTSRETSAGVEVIRADPGMRRLAILGFVGAVGLGAATIGIAVPWLVRALEEAVATGRVSNRAVCIGFLAFVAANGLGAIAIGFWGARLGGRVVDAGEFPLPGARVIRDTRVVRGSAARLVGRGQQVIGALIVVTATALVGLCTYALRFFL